MASGCPARMVTPCTIIRPSVPCGKWVLQAGEILNDNVTDVKILQVDESRLLSAPPVTTSCQQQQPQCL